MAKKVLITFAKLYPKLEAILKDLGIEDYEKPKGKRKSKSNK